MLEKKRISISFDCFCNIPFDIRNVYFLQISCSTCHCVDSLCRYSYYVDSLVIHICISVPGEDVHQVLPAAMKLAFRYHLQTLCSTRHCVDSLVIYLNSPTKLDGTSLLWDVDGNGMVISSNLTILGHF